MDELKNKTYLEFVAEKELAEEANRPAEDKKELSKGERFVKSLVHFWSYKKWYVIIPRINGKTSSHMFLTEYFSILRGCS